jgi:hypothetical protein
MGQSNEHYSIKQKITTDEILESRCWRAISSLLQAILDFILAIALKTGISSFLRPVAGYRRIDRKLDQDFRQELNIHSLNTGNKIIPTQIFRTRDKNDNRVNSTEDTRLQTSRKTSGTTSKKMERSVHIKIGSEQAND